MYVCIYSFFATWRCFSAQDYRRRASIAITEKDLYLVLLGARVKPWTNQSLYLVDEVLDWLAQVIVGMWGVLLQEPLGDGKKRQSFCLFLFLPEK